MAATKGRICESCKDARMNIGAPPRRLVKLPTTSSARTAVYVCEFCDGPVVERAQRLAQQRLDRRKK